MITQLYNTDSRIASQLLAMAWKTFYVTYLILIINDFARDVYNKNTMDGFIFLIIKMDFIIVGRVLYEILDRSLEPNKEVYSKLDEISKAVWKISNQIRR
jgi:hypothetical protein